MKLHRCRDCRMFVVVLIACLGAGLAAAEDAAESAELSPPATTPTSLAVLLAHQPDAGFTWDCYLVCDSSDNQIDAFIEHCRLVVNEHGMQVDYRQVYAGLPRSGSHETTVYDASGDLVAYYHLEEINATHFMEWTGRIEDDALQLTFQNFNREEPRNNVPSTTRVALEPDRGAVPWHWLELAIGYHLHAGHDGFVVRRRGYRGSTDIQVMEIQDIGTETFNLHGKETRVHVLVAKTRYETEDGRPTQSPWGVEDAVRHYRCLPSGQIVQTRTMQVDSDHPQVYLYEAMDEDRVRRQFGEEVYRRLSIDPDPALGQLEEGN